MNMFNIKEVRNHEEHFIGDEDNDFDRVFKAINNNKLRFTGSTYDNIAYMHILLFPI